MIIDGKRLADEILKKKVIDKKLNLCVISVGDNESSKIYINNKRKKCEELGIEFMLFQFKDCAKEEAIIDVIDKLNTDNTINGIIVQLPLPNNFNINRILNSIDINKDVDGFNFYNKGALLAGENNIVPATPKGIIKLLESLNIDFLGKHAVIVGRSNLVGKPTALLLLQKDCTVTICHSKTKNLSKYTKQADILVVAVGKPKFIKSSMIKKGAIIIDVGINRADGKIVGDVDFEGCKLKAKHITPVPGGVGPMTVAMLIDNLIKNV